MKKIVICGGHLTPALALLEELETESDTKVVFFGRKFSTEGGKNLSAEYRIINSKNIPFVTITSGRLQRRFTKYTIPSLLKIPVGLVQSFYNLLKFKPDIVVSFGGYLSTPVVFCAWLLGIESVSHEQAAVPGLANRINALFAKKIFLSWPGTQKYFPKEKSEVVGNLIRKSLFNKKIENKKLQNFLDGSKNLIFVTGGNQGSHFLNLLTFALVPKLKDFTFLHQVGTANYENDFEKSQKIKNPNYMALEYLAPDEIGTAFERAQIVISRSGANTVWEVATLKKVAIFIPLPISASQEQLENAKTLESAGLAKIIMQDDADIETVSLAIENVAKNINKYGKKAESFSKTLPKNAVGKIVNYIYSEK